MVSAWPDEARVLRAGDRVCLIVRCWSRCGWHPGPVSQPAWADASKAGRLSGAARYWFIADPRRRLRRLSTPAGGGHAAWLQWFLQPFCRDRRSARLLLSMGDSTSAGKKELTKCRTEKRCRTGQRGYSDAQTRPARD